MAETFGHPRLFPGMTTMWNLTAAQRSFMLGKPEEKKPKVPLLTQADLKRYETMINEEEKRNVRIGDDQLEPPIRVTLPNAD